MAKETELRALTAINCAKFTDFVVSDDESGAYCFADDKSVFFVDFSSGKETEMTLRNFKMINGDYHFRSAVRFEYNDNDSEDATQFIRIIIEENSMKVFCVLYSATVRKETVSVIDEMDTTFTSSSDYSSYLYRAKCGKNFFVLYSIKERTLIVSEISLNESRKLKIETRARHEQLTDPWRPFPFVDDDAVFYFTDSNWKQLIKLPFDGTKTSKISLSYKDEPPPIANSFPVCYNENILFSLRGDRKKIIEIYALNRKEFRWSRIRIVTSYHGTVRRSQINISSDGSAFILIRIDECAKIYQLDLSVNNKYIVSQRELGKGGFGVVVEGIINDSQIVAVKILRDLSAVPNDRKQQILLSAIFEARKLKMLHHNNIVKGFGFVIEENRFMLFMELMTESVRQKLLRTVDKRLEEKEAFKILQQVLEGLVYLHTLNPKPIVHRDIKCANILLDRNGNAKLGDLGLIDALCLNTAGTTDPSLAPNELAGTCYWQAPEVLDHGSKYGRKADAWSIGCSLVEMLTGYPPYVSLTVAKWAVGLSSGRLAYNPSELVPFASLDVVDFLEKCFRRETKKPTLIHGEDTQRIRPHSWELLADVIEISELKPIEEKRRYILNEADEKMRNIQIETDEKMQNVDKEADAVIKKLSELRGLSKAQP